MGRFSLCAFGLALAAPVSAQETSEVRLAREVLSGLQEASFREDREYCGYIGYDAAGVLIATAPTPGEQGSCLPDEPDQINLLTASYHTHGAYSPDYVNEVPSIDDVESDEAEGIDGYVATPGGRFWYVDTEDLVISQICGLGCLPSDPDFVRGSDGHIEPSYTYDALVEAIDEAGG